MLLDRNRRQKQSAQTLFVCFVGGLVTIVLAIALYRLIDLVLLPVKPFNADNLLLSDLLSGPVEELAKFLIFWIITRALRSLKEPVDAMLQAAAVALAFASVENVLYGFAYGDALVVLKRLLTSTLGHLTFAAIWGLCTACLRFGLVRVGPHQKRRFLLPAVLGAAVLHTLYNLLLSTRFWYFAFAVDAVSLLAAYLIYRSLASMALYQASPVREPRRAVEALQKSLRNGSDLPAAHLRLGLAHLALGETAAAERHLGRCRALRPGNSQVAALLGCAHILAGRVDEGEALLDAAFVRLGPRGRWHLRRTVNRILARRPLERGSAEQAHRFFLYHFFEYAGSRP